MAKTIGINSGTGRPAKINAPGNQGMFINRPDYKSYLLDGVDDYLSIPQTTLNFGPTDPQSYELWFKLNSLVGVEKTLFSIFGTSGTKIYVSNANYISFTIRNTSTNRILCRAEFATDPPGYGDAQVVANIWNHLIITKEATADANGVNFHHDSLLLGKTLQTNNLTLNPNNIANVFLGSQGTVGTSRSNCEIALCRVFSKVLSQEEISTLYNNGQPLLTTNISNKVFEVIPGATLRDSVNNVTGTVSGAILKSCDVNGIVRNGKQYFNGNNLYYNTYSRAGEWDRDTISDSPFTDARRSIYYDESTGRHYIGWQQRPYLGGNRESMLMYVDSTQGFASPSYPMGVLTVSGKDNHGAPSVIGTEDGEILVIREDQHGTPLYLTKTINKSMVNLQQLPPTQGFHAYPVPAKLSNGLVIWTRGNAADSGDPTKDQIMHSVDNGVTWSSPFTVLDLAIGLVWQRAYFRSIYHPTKIILLILRRQEDVGFYKEIYYVESDDGFTFRNITGSYSRNVPVSGLIPQADMSPNFSIVSDTTDIGLKTATYIDGSAVGYYNSEDVNSPYKYFYWNGSAWAFKDLPFTLYTPTQAEGNTGRIDQWCMYAYSLNHQIIWRQETRSGYDVIVRYETFDNADTWDAGTVISAPNKNHEQMQQTYNVDAPSIIIAANVVEEGSLDNNLFIHKFIP